MTWPNVLALAVFVCVCGFIAYWGDILGRRMGKRRLTIFGLRPRYTAIVTTTITGMLIAVFTIAVMVIASDSAHQLVLRGAQILKEHRAAQEAYARATKELSYQRRVAVEAREDAKEAVRQRNLLTAEIARLTGELGRLRADLRKSKAALVLAEKRLRVLTAERERLTQDVKTLRADLDQNREVLAKAQGELSTTKADLESAREQLANAQTDITAAKREIEARKQEISEREKDIARLEEKRARLETWLRNELAPKYKALLERRIIFGVNEEIARRVIRCDQPKADIRRELLALLDDADSVARAKGAEAGDNPRSVEIIHVKLETGTQGEEVPFTESQIIDAVVDNISADSGSVVVLVVSIGNSVDGEQALVDLIPCSNVLVYSAGDEIADTTIDGSLSRGRILESLVTFLRTEVRAAAIAHSVIPRRDEEGQLSVGTIDDWDQVFDLLDRIRAAGKPVRVKAVAKKDTWSADLLAVDLVAGDSQ